VCVCVCVCVCACACAYACVHCGRSVTKWQKMTAKFMKIKKEEGKKEAFEGTWTRVQCEDTERVLPAEKRSMKEAK